MGPFSDFLSAGTLVGRYRVVGALAMGGMARVYEAVHVDLNTPVAVKLLDAQYASTPEYVERFHREAQAAATISSPHVAKVIDVGTLPDGRPYLVMELLVGADVGALLLNGPFTIQEAIDIVHQAARGIEAAHALGIVHRDVKPENLFACDLGPLANGRRLVKVVDFGIAKDMREGASRMTEPNSTMGSVRYMAPEQIRSASAVDSRTDVWALGAVLYELLVGSPAFDGPNQEVLAKILTELPPSIRDRRPDVPAGIEQIYERATARDPEARFGSMAELALDLGAFAPREAIATLLGRLPPESIPRKPTAVPTSRSHDATDAGWSSRPRVSVRASPALYAVLGLVAIIGCVLAAFAIRHRSTPPITAAAPANESASATETATPPTSSSSSVVSVPAVVPARDAPTSTPRARSSARPVPHPRSSDDGLPKRF